MYTVKWSVLQYVIIRPACSIAGIICQAYNVLCESGSFDVHFANVYLEAIDFVSISIALYGLLLFYGLTKDELVGRRPLSKFLAIKLIVMFTFYQSFVFSALEGRVIHSTTYWTATNIADGLNALAICIEMVFFSAFMWWAYTVNEYKVKGGEKTSIWRPLWDSINYTDFVIEIAGSLKFFFDCSRGKRPTHAPARRASIGGAANNGNNKMDFGEAFGVSGSTYSKPRPAAVSGESPTIRPRPSYDEDIRLAPYSYNESRILNSSSPVSE